MANYMAEIAKMLGVELGEEFDIKYPPPSSVKTTAVFSENGFRIVKTDAYILIPNWQESTLHSLLKGDLAIKRKPWRPQMHDIFWHIDRYGEPVLGTWNTCPRAYDENFYKIGNCYQTAQEAKANRDKWIAFYESDEVLEV